MVDRSGPGNVDKWNIILPAVKVRLQFSQILLWVLLSCTLSSLRCIKIFDKSVRTSHKTNPYPPQTSQLILFRKITNVYSGTQTQHIKTIHGKNTDSFDVNPLNTELNPICHLLVLLGAHHILHISRIRVNHVTHIATNQFQKVKRYFESRHVRLLYIKSLSHHFSAVTWHNFILWLVQKLRFILYYKLFISSTLSVTIQVFSELCI